MLDEARVSAPREPDAAETPRRHPLVERITYALCWPLFHRYFRLSAMGQDRVPRAGRMLLAPNHVSMLDWAFLSFFLPEKVRFLVDRAYYQHPLFGLGLRVNGAVPVRTTGPNKAAVRAAHAVLAADQPLIVFPEGRISTTGRPQRPQPGIIVLASATRTPILPVALRGAFEAFPRWSKFPRPRRVTVVFGEPLDPPPPVQRRAQQQEQADRLMGYIGALLDGDARPAAPW